MPRQTEQEAIGFIRSVFQEHEQYWEDRSEELQKYRHAYESRFWTDHGFDEQMVRIETADAYAFIEGFISSLYTKNPSVVITRDLSANSGRAHVAEAVANRFLSQQRQEIENASRLAFIYDYSALKLVGDESDDMLNRVLCQAIPCWEVIVDRDAYSPKTQRYVGHAYYITLSDAKDKFGNKKFQAVPRKDYFEDAKVARASKASQLPDEYMYIQVVELYDLAYDQVYYWSPSYQDGTKLLSRAQIPIRTYDDKPLPPISLLYFARSPSKPMEGISAMSRVYDQIYEMNILRTYWANSVRRDSRQYLYKEGVLDEEALSQITAGIDGAMIGVDSDTLEGIIRPVSVEPISSNFDRYIQQVQQDLQTGTMMAPFSRGEATKATATEISALAQYTASEVGKHARTRDETIERLVEIYLRHLVLLADEDETVIMEIGNEAEAVTPDALESRWVINAVDGGSTPVADSIKKQEFVNLIPTLIELDVSKEKIKKELVGMFDLPQDFLEPEPAPEQAPAAAPMPGQGAMPAVAPEPDMALGMQKYPGYGMVDVTDEGRA